MCKFLLFIKREGYFTSECIRVNTKLLASSKCQASLFQKVLLDRSFAITNWSFVRGTVFFNRSLHILGVANIIRRIIAGLGKHLQVIYLINVFWQVVL